MKRIIMIVAIPLLVVLSAWFGAKSQTYNDPKTFPNLVPEVSEFGTLTNLKDEKGRRLSSKPIQEGFYVRFRVGKSKERVLYAIGDRASELVRRCQERIPIPGAAITTLDGLNVSSGFIFDKSKGTLSVIRTIVNLSNEEATMYLSEVKNHADTKLLATNKATMYPSEVKNHADTKLLAKKKDTMNPSEVKNHADTKLPSEPIMMPTSMSGPCWPCMPYPACLPQTKGKSTTSQEPTERSMKQLLTLPVGSAIVLTTEYKIILSKEVARP